MKYKVISNYGSLSGGGPLKDHSQEIEADSEEEARKLFNRDMVNQMYGRKIKEVQEIT